MDRLENYPNNTNKINCLYKPCNVNDAYQTDRSIQQTLFLSNWKIFYLSHKVYIDTILFDDIFIVLISPDSLCKIMEIVRINSAASI